MDSPCRSPIVIVSGLPRSGTSLMMQMLERGGLSLLTDGLRAADEDNPRGYFELEAVKKTREDASWLNAASGRSVKVIYKLLYDLPDDHKYRVIFMRRGLDEVLSSQAAMLKRRGTDGAALPPDRMMRVFEKQLGDVLGYMSETACFEYLEVDYKQLIDDALSQAKMVNTFLGGGLDPQKMTEVVDADLYRQRA